MKLIATILALLATAGQVVAGGCGIGYCRPTYSAPYVAPYVPPVVITQYVPFFSFVPVGFATYTPVVAAPAVPLTALAPVPQAAAVALPTPSLQLPVTPIAAPAAAVDPCAQRLAGLAARLDALERENVRLRSAMAPPVPNTMPQAKDSIPPPKEVPQSKDGGGLAVLSNRCAKCHDSAKAATDGGNFVMFDKGQLVPLTDTQLLLCYRNILKGAMPPPKEGKLTDDEGQSLLAFFDTYKAAVAKKAEPAKK